MVLSCVAPTFQEGNGDVAQRLGTLLNQGQSRFTKHLLRSRQQPVTLHQWCEALLKLALKQLWKFTQQGFITLDHLFEFSDARSQSIGFVFLLSISLHHVQ